MGLFYALTLKCFNFFFDIFNTSIILIFFKHQMVILALNSIQLQPLVMVVTHVTIHFKYVMKTNQINYHSIRVIQAIMIIIQI